MYNQSAFGINPGRVTRSSPEDGILVTSQEPYLMAPMCPKPLLSLRLTFLSMSQGTGAGGQSLQEAHCVVCSQKAGGEH